MICASLVLLRSFFVNLAMKLSSHEEEFDPTWTFCILFLEESVVLRLSKPASPSTKDALCLDMYASVSNVFLLVVNVCLLIRYHLHLDKEHGPLSEQTWIYLTKGNSVSSFVLFAYLLWRRRFIFNSAIFLIIFLLAKESDGLEGKSDLPHDPLCHSLVEISPVVMEKLKIFPYESRLEIPLQGLHAGYDQVGCNYSVLWKVLPYILWWRHMDD